MFKHFSLSNFSLSQRLRAAALAFFITSAALLLIVQNYLGRGFLTITDIRLANFLYARRTAAGIKFFYGVTLLAESVVVIIAAGVAIIILWRYRQRALALGLTLALILSEGATYLGKIIFHRARPLFPAISESSWSFPSGHATTVVVFYGFLTYLLFRHARTRPHRILIIFIFILLVLLVDFSRLYLGVHYLSDVLAGNLVGLAGVIFAVGTVEALGFQPTGRFWSLPGSLKSGVLLSDHDLKIARTAFAARWPKR